MNSFEICIALNFTVFSSFFSSLFSNTFYLSQSQAYDEMNRQVMDAIVSMVLSYVHLLMETICNINVVLFASVNSKTITLNYLQNVVDC